MLQCSPYTERRGVCVCTCWGTVRVGGCGGCPHGGLFSSTHMCRYCTFMVAVLQPCRLYDSLLLSDINDLNSVMLGHIVSLTRVLQLTVYLMLILNRPHLSELKQLDYTVMNQ